MANGKFEHIKNIHINKIDLDTENPRFGERADEKQCIEAILQGHERHIMKLIKDIATNGLYPESIIVSKGSREDRWTVKDGNRRITALKLLHDPRKAPQALQRDIKKIKDSSQAYPTRIDAVCFNHNKDLQNFLKIKHTGFNDGIGQAEWSALAQAIYNDRNGNPDTNIKAYKLLEWAKENGNVKYDESFPITTLADRVMAKERLEKIGFVFENGELIQIRDTISTLNKVRQIIDDIYSQKVSSRSLPNAVEQDNYIKELCSTHGSGDLLESEQVPSETIPPSNITITPSQNNSSDEEPLSYSTPAQKTKADRRQIVSKKDIAVMGIPDTETKLHKILREISDLNVKTTPMSVAVLTRAVFELSVDHYIDKHSLPFKNDDFHKKIRKSAEHMRTHSKINEDQLLVIKKRTQDQDDMLHVSTLHKYVHSSHFHPDYYRLNAFWDETEFFIRKCWRNY